MMIALGPVSFNSPTHHACNGRMVHERGAVRPGQIITYPRCCPRLEGESDFCLLLRCGYVDSNVGIGAVCYDLCIIWSGRDEDRGSSTRPIGAEPCLSCPDFSGVVAAKCVLSNMQSPTTCIYKKYHCIVSIFNDNEHGVL